MSMSANEHIPREKVCQSDYLNIFKSLMRTELTANKRKGDFVTWTPDVYQVIAEASYHLAKLNKALLEVERANNMNAKKEVTEFAADVANIMMKAVQTFGDGFDKMRQEAMVRFSTGLLDKNKSLEKVRVKLFEIAPFMDNYSNDEWDRWLNALPKDEFLALLTIDRSRYKDFAEGKYSLEVSAA